MLGRLFTSKTRVKILDLLLFNEDKDYYLRELARIINISPIYVSKELNNLLKLKLVNKTVRGNLTIYSIKKDNNILKDLRSIFIKLKK